MPHSLASHARGGHFNATAFTHNPTVAYTPILAAMTFPILNRTKDLFAKQTSAFRLKGAVINGLRFFNLTIRPAENFLRRSDSDSYCLKFFVCFIGKWQD